MIKTATVITGLALALVWAASTAAAPGNWRLYTDTAYGVTALYPAQVFQPVQPRDDIPGKAFRSADGQARMAIGAWDNAENETPGTYRDRLLSDDMHPDITYKPRGRGWFVISGYRGDKIYYEKVIYSCARRVVNVFAIIYPKSQRAAYDPIVERMEDNFRAGKRCN